MNLEILTAPEYNFLSSHEHLGKNVILLGLGGSHAYGTNVPESDLDIRGIATNRIEDILLEKDFEQIVETNTDTTIYSVEKIIKLLSGCNPNTIEILGLKPEHYLYLTDAGKLLLDNKKIFLSKLAIYTFSGYADSQLRRMENKAARDYTQDVYEANILKSIQNAMFDLRLRYEEFGADDINLYLDFSNAPNIEKEIYIDVNLKHYPLRDYGNLYGEMMNIIKAYNKNNHRNTNAIEHGKLGKHMMHLVRLYYMCFDILEKEDIITYRETELPLLMQIRNGHFLDKNNQPIPEFYELLDGLNSRLEYAKNNTNLPDKCDMKNVDELHYEINKKVVLNALC